MDFSRTSFCRKRGVQIKEIHQAVYYARTESLFDKFVTYFEKLKNDNTYDPKNPNKKINPALRNFSKLVLNSLYGKFATGRERTSYTSLREIIETIEKLMKKEEIFSPEIKFFKSVLNGNIDIAQDKWMKEEDLSILGRMPKRYKIPRLNDHLIQFNSYLTSEYVQVQISSYVTALARLELYKGIENIISRGGKVYYCDTDSIVSDIKLEPHFVHDYEFGKWKLEGEIKKGYFAQPKVYFEETITGKTNKKFKGLPHGRVEYLSMSDYAYINKRQELQDVESIPLIKKEDGYVNQIKPITALKTNQDFNKILVIEKGLNIRGLKEKRKMDYKNNTSHPWSFDPGTKNEMEEYFEELRKENLTWVEEQADKIYKYVQKEGYIQIPKKGTYLYKKYLEIPPKIRKRYFRMKGLALDIVSYAVDYHPEDLLMELSMEM